MKQSTLVDAVLSHADRSCRIFYLQSWDRAILRKIFDESAVLRAWLTPDSLQNGFSDYTEKGVVCEFSAFEEISDRKIKEKIRCLYRYDAQMQDSKSFALLLHCFLSEPCYENKLLLLSGTERVFPVGFEDEILLIPVPYLEKDEIETIIRAFFPSIGEKPCAMLCRELGGNTEMQIRQMLETIKNYGYLDVFNRGNENECVRLIRSTRERLIDRDGLLSIRHFDKEPGVRMPEYADWIRKRKMIALDPAEARRRGTAPLKGVIMIGLPGTGKTMAAELTAYELNLPYVDFRLDELQNSDYGGSEERLRKYRDRINALSGGTVVVFDEIEKALGSSEGTRHEATNSLLGIFLKWMNEASNVFFYLTCNDADKLPPELMRPGRLNARFLTFMPSENELRSIFLFHLREKHETTGALLQLRGAAHHEKAGGGEASEAFERVAGTLFEQMIGALLAGTDQKPDPFMTGADIAQIIEDTNITLWNQGLRMPYSPEQYSQALIKCAKEMRMTGETSFPEIVRIWRYARKNGIAFVSGKDMICHDGDYDLFSGSFTDFSDVPPAVKSYNAWFEYRFKHYIHQMTKKH